jgi:hypothetical protein
MRALGLVSAGLAVLVLGVVSAPALGFSAPTVNDKPAFASDVSQFGATLNGTVDPEGVLTSYHFVYGMSTGYGSVVPVPDEYVPVNEEDDGVSQTLVELAPGTTYHFALVANSPAGHVVGPDETFTTPAVPVPVVVTGGSSEVGLGAATLSGLVDPQSFQTGYYFEYGPSAVYGQRWPSIGVALGSQSGAQSVVTFLQNLQPGTLYHYRLVAVNPGGVGYGADQTLTTLEYPASVIQEAPVLKAPFGFNPETGSGSGAPAKHKARRKARKKGGRRAKGGRKGRKR